MLEGITKILNLENVTMDPEAFNLFYDRCKGDMRALDDLYTISLNTKHITVNDIVESANVINDETYELFFRYITTNNFKSACNLIEPKLIPSLFNKLMEDNNHPLIRRDILAIQFAEYDFRTKSFSVTDKIQLYALVANIMKTFK